MKKYFSALLLMAVALFATATLTSCGDDEVEPSTPSQPQGSYLKCEVYVRIDHNANANPFIGSDKEAEDKVISDLTNLIGKELEKVDGVKKQGDTYYYDDDRRTQVWAAIRAAMDKLEPTIKSQNIKLDGQIVCEVSGFGGETIWIKTADYTQPSTSFTYNDINYCVINDTEAGVVIKAKNNMGDSAYTGDIEIPETVQNEGKTYTITAIGPKAFYSSSITSIKLPKTLTTLYTGCFGYTKKLTSITLPGKLNNYAKSSSTASSSLNSPYFDGSAITEAVLEEGITTLCEMMFRGASSLQKVVLPSTVTEISKACFSGCQNLSDVTVNGTLTFIGEQGFYNTPITSLSIFKFKGATIDHWAFRTCKDLEAIDIPEGVTTLGSACFSYCDKATTATIPASVTSMSISIFSNAKALKEIHVKGDKPATLEEESTIDGEVLDTFNGLDFAAQGLTIYVPSASVDAYKKAAIWSKYASYIEGE